MSATIVLQVIPWYVSMLARLGETGRFFCGSDTANHQKLAPNVDGDGHMLTVVVRSPGFRISTNTALNRLALRCGTTSSTKSQAMANLDEQ
jgi:hypothetical protein